MSNILSRQRALSASREDVADKPFLRRILFGLIAATIFSGVTLLGLTSHQELIENFQVASTHGPA